MKPKRTRPAKKLCAQSRSRLGRIARALTLSFYPKHMHILAQRERETGIHRSILMQILLELELRDNLLAREILARLARANSFLEPETSPQTQCHNETNQSNSLAHRHD